MVVNNTYYTFVKSIIEGGMYLLNYIMNYRCCWLHLLGFYLSHSELRVLGNNVLELTSNNK